MPMMNTDEAVQEIRSDYNGLNHNGLLFGVDYVTTAMIRANPQAQSMDNGRIGE